MMTAAQRNLARRALGLPNNARRSCQNQFLCHEATRAYTNWARMESRGYAMRLRSEGDEKVELVCFYLTRAGAEQALMSKESLCEEDFPPL